MTNHVSKKALVGAFDLFEKIFVKSDHFLKSMWKLKTRWHHSLGVTWKTTDANQKSDESFQASTAFTKRSGLKRCACRANDLQAASYCATSPVKPGQRTGGGRAEIQRRKWWNSLFEIHSLKLTTVRTCQVQPSPKGDFHRTQPSIFRC